MILPSPYNTQLPYQTIFSSIIMDMTETMYFDNKVSIKDKEISYAMQLLRLN